MAKRYWSLVNVSGGGIYQELLSPPFLISLISEEHAGGFQILRTLLLATLRDSTAAWHQV